MNRYAVALVAYQCIHLGYCLHCCSRLLDKCVLLFVERMAESSAPNVHVSVLQAVFIRIAGSG